MGSGSSMTSRDWGSYAQSNNIHKGASAQSMYTSTGMKDEFDPSKLKNGIRDARDTVGKEPSTPIMLGLDVTGSMDSMLATVLTRLGDLVTGIVDRKVVTDPHILSMAIGDVYSDSVPFQVTQFETDIKIAQQLKDLYKEGRGGGNGGESYSLAWYFAAKHTEIDSFDKRGKKGFIFTIGDEDCHKKIPADDIRSIFGDRESGDIDSEAILKEASERYEIYHLLLPFCGSHDFEDTRWKGLLGERVIRVTDLDKIPEIIISILQLMAGDDKDTILNSWDSSTSLVVREAIQNLTPQVSGGANENGLITF